MTEPLEPTDIWTADGRKVVSGMPRDDQRATPAVPVPLTLGALALAPVAVAAVAAGLAVASAVAATGLASAAARALLPGPSSYRSGPAVPFVRITVVRLDLGPWSDDR